MEWQKSGLERRVQKPAFEVIFAYSSKTGALEIWFGGSIKVVRELQSIFARTVLKSELPPEKKDEPLYDLSSLRSGRFEFPFEAGSGIESVRIKKLGLSIMGEHSRRITLEADSSENANAVYDLMAQVIQMEDAPDCGKCNRIPIALVNISHVSLEVQFVPSGKRGRHSKSFSLAYPSSCTLKDDERDMLLRDMLIKWGFEKPHSTPKER